MRRLQVAVPRKKKEMESEFAIAVPGEPLCDGQFQCRTQGRLALRPHASVFKFENFPWEAHRLSAQRYCRSAAGARGSKATAAAVGVQRRVGRFASAIA